MIVTGKIISAQVTKAGKARLRIHQSLLPETDKRPLSVLCGLILEKIYKLFTQTDRQLSVNLYTGLLIKYFIIMYD